MIRLLLIITIILFVIWLLLNLFSSHKDEKIKIGLSPKLLIFIISLIAIFILIKFLPKILALLPSLQGFLGPIIGILRNFLPFI